MSSPQEKPTASNQVLILAEAVCSSRLGEVSPYKQQAPIRWRMAAHLADSFHLRTEVMLSALLPSDRH
jgi:hypothetical protein